MKVTVIRKKCESTDGFTKREEVKFDDAVLVYVKVDDNRVVEVTPKSIVQLFT